MPCVTKHREDSLQESEGTKMVEVALDSGRTFGRGCDMWLAGCPRQKAVGGGPIPGHTGLSVAANRCGKQRCLIADRCQPVFEECGRPGDEPGLIQFGTLGKHVFFQHVEPAVHNVSQCPFGRVRRCQPLHEPSVHRFKFVKRCLRLGNLHLTCHEPLSAGSVSKPTGEERLAAAVVAPHGLEYATAGRHGFEIGIDCGLESFEAHAEGIEAGTGHRAASQRVDDLLGTGPADRGSAHACSASSSEMPN